MQIASIIAPICHKHANAIFLHAVTAHHLQMNFSLPPGLRLPWVREGGLNNNFLYVVCYRQIWNSTVGLIPQKQNKQGVNSTKNNKHELDHTHLKQHILVRSLRDLAWIALVLVYWFCCFVKHELPWMSKTKRLTHCPNINDLIFYVAANLASARITCYWTMI